MDAALWEQDIEDGMKQGALWGAVFGLVRTEQFRNTIRGDGWISNETLYNQWSEQGRYQDIIDRFAFKQGVYDPSNTGFKQHPNSRAFTDIQGNTLYGDLAFESYVEFRTASFDEYIHGVQYAQGRFPNRGFDPMTYNELQAEAFIADYRNGGLLGHNKAYSTRLLNNIYANTGIIVTPTSTYYAFDERWWHFFYRIPRVY